MRVLIPGGRGFIGGALAGRLLSLGHVVDVSSSTVGGASDLHGNYRFWKTDASEAFTEIPELQEIDVVVYLAGISSSRAIEETQSMFRVNVLRPASLLKTLDDRKPRKFVYVSTAHVTRLLAGSYVDPGSGDDSLALYSASKLAAEEILREYARGTSTEVASLRLDNCFGTPNLMLGRDTAGVVNDLCRQGVATGRLILNSSSDVSRKFVPLESCIRTITDMLHKPIMCEAVGGLDADSCSLSLLELAQVIYVTMRRLFDSQTQIIFRGVDFEVTETEAASIEASIPNGFRESLEKLLRHYRNHDG